MSSFIRFFEVVEWLLFKTNFRLPQSMGNSTKNDSRTAVFSDSKSIDQVGKSPVFSIAGNDQRFPGFFSLFTFKNQQLASNIFSLVKLDSAGEQKKISSQKSGILEITITTYDVASSFF